MRNDVQIKTTLLLKIDTNELVFDYYNRERKYVGNVTITGKGKISWYIMDLNYLDNIRDLIDFIMGNNEKIRVHYESSDEDRERWRKACIYAYNHNFVINYRQNETINEIKESKKL